MLHVQPIPHGYEYGDRCLAISKKLFESTPPSSFVATSLQQLPATRRSRCWC